MAANAELLYEGYSVEDGLDRRAATHLYFVSGLSPNPDHEEAFNALPVRKGSEYPVGNLPGAICTGLRLIERIDDTKAMVAAYFSTRRWSFQTRVIAQYDVDLSTITAPYFVRIEQSNAQTGARLTTWHEYEQGIVRNRGVIRKYTYSTVSGQITDAQADYIAGQVGRLYTFGSTVPQLGLQINPAPEPVPYLFTGATVTVSSGGVSTLRKAFMTTASLQSLFETPPASSGENDPDNVRRYAMTIPRLGPLDEYVKPHIMASDDPARVRIGVLKAKDNYEIGSDLP